MGGAAASSAARRGPGSRDRLYLQREQRAKQIGNKKNHSANRASEARSEREGATGCQEGSLAPLHLQHAAGLTAAGEARWNVRPIGDRIPLHLPPEETSMRHDSLDGRRSTFRRRAGIPFALAFLAASAFACRGREDAGAGAAAVAGRFLTAVGARQWDSAAAMVDSAELRRFPNEQLAFVANIAEHQHDIERVMSASGSGGMASFGEPLTLDTTMVARNRAWRIRVLEGQPTLGELAALPAQRFYARMYALPLNCWFLPSVRALRIVGTVLDADSLAYVVYQMNPDVLERKVVERKTAVLALTRSAGKWGVRPGGLEPAINPGELLDTSVAGRAAMVEACTQRNR